MRLSNTPGSITTSYIKAPFVAVIIVAAILTGIASAQIDVNETGLNSGQEVYGLEATTVSPPYINAEDITLWALGETDPLAYLDTSFKAYGFYCDVNMVNTGAITVNAVGGNVTAASSVEAWIQSYGVYAYDGNDVSNSGNIAVAVTGGTADANEADVSVHGYGLYAKNSFEWPLTYSGIIELVASSGVYTENVVLPYGLGGVTVTPSDRQVTNTGDIDVTVTGGTATAYDENAIARAEGFGIYAVSGNVENSGAIDVNVTGGLADANDGQAYAMAEALGILALRDDINNVGDVTLQVSGGTANGENASVRAFSIGLWSDDGVVVNTGDITATVTAGTGTSTGGIEYGDPAATAYGIMADSEASNTGNITLSVDGGMAKSSGDNAQADARAVGIHAVTVHNTGTLDLNVDGGRAYAYGTANADASGTGIVAKGQADNAGDISVDVQAFYAVPQTDGGQGSAQASAFGIDAVYDVNNTGSIDVMAIGGIAADTIRIVDWPSTYSRIDGGVFTSADAGADASGIVSQSDVNNVGPIAVVASGGGAKAVEEALALSYAKGLYSEGMLDNAGDLSISAVGGDAIATGGVAYADGNAYGLMSDNSIVNAGVVTVAAMGGIATADIAADADPNNPWPPIGFGSGLAHASAEAHGVSAVSDISNSGAIFVTASGGTAEGEFMTNTSATSYGIQTSGEVTNTGNITATSFGGTTELSELTIATAVANGIVADGHITNMGDILAFAKGGTTDANESAYAFGMAYGIRASGDVTNRGNVTATAIGGTAQGDDETDASGYAYGIYMDGNGLLTNTGTLRASGDTAYEVYVAGGTTTLVDIYNVALDGDPNKASVGVADEATLDLNDATLTVTHVNGQTRWNTTYRLFETIGSGAVDGNFAEAKAINPDTMVTYDTQGTSNSADDTVALSFNPTSSEFAGSTAVEKQLVWQSRDVVHHRMTSTMLNSVLYPSSSGLLVDAGPVGKSLGLAQSDSGSERAGVFIEPYYLRMDQEADPLGYDARLWGIAAGYERQMDNTLISFHAGYGQADIDYTGEKFNANSEDQDILTGGLTSLSRWDDWTLRCGVTGFYGWHDYQGITGLLLDETETASMNSYGLMASAMIGHIFQRGSHVLLPEVGVNYLWGHRPCYTTEATDPNWDATFSSMDDHDVEAEAALHWLTGFMHGDIHVAPSVSVGIRHLLTDDESVISHSIPGQVALVKSERDRTAMTLSGSVSLSRSNHALSVAYDGQYSNHTDRHSLWLRYGWQF